MPGDGGVQSRSRDQASLPASSSYPPIMSDEEEREVSAAGAGKTYPQVCAALVACLGAFLMGTAIGWSAPAVNQLQNNATSPFVVSDTDANWIGSLTPAGALFGSLFGGYMTDRFGRKSVMYLSALHFSLGYALLVAATGPAMLCVGRLICGLACGLVTTSCPTYIAEIASPKVRGILGSMFQLLVTVGVLWTSVIGAAVNWRWLSVSILVFVLLWVVLLSILPNSPIYLLSKQQFEAARLALQKLRGTDRVEAELSEAQNAVLEAARSRSGRLKDLGRREILRPLLVSVFLMMGQQFSGVNAVLFYAVGIFDAAHSNISPFVENIVLNIVQVVITGVSTVIIDRSGRKVLLISSASTMCVTIGGLGAFFYLQGVDPTTADKITFLPIACLCVFIAAFSLGYGGIPWLMMSELMAPEMKAISNSVAAGANWTMAFMITRFYGDAADTLGKPATFWAFAVFSFIQVVGVAAFVPETKGRTLDQIQQEFRRRRQPTDVADSGGGPIMDTDSDLIIDNEEVYPAEGDEAVNV